MRSFMVDVNGMRLSDNRSSTHAKSSSATSSASFALSTLIRQTPLQFAQVLYRFNVHRCTSLVVDNAPFGATKKRLGSKGALP